MVDIITGQTLYSPSLMNSQFRRYGESWMRRYYYDDNSFLPSPLPDVSVLIKSGASLSTSNGRRRSRSPMHCHVNVLPEANSNLQYLVSNTILPQHTATFLTSNISSGISRFMFQTQERRATRVLCSWLVTLLNA